MDYCDLMLDKPYQYDRATAYHSVPNTYMLWKDTHDYIMTSSSGATPSKQAQTSALTLVTGSKANHLARNSIEFTVLVVR